MRLANSILHKRKGKWYITRFRKLRDLRHLVVSTHAFFWSRCDHPDRIRMEKPWTP